MILNDIASYSPRGEKEWLANGSVGIAKEIIAEHTTPASPATALASMVLPVPGGPVNRTPLGNLPPRVEK